MERPPLSPIASNLLLRCSRMLDAPVDEILEEIHLDSKSKEENSSRKLVEFCCSKAIGNLCCEMEEKIAGGSFGRFTFDMMLAWENPTSISEKCYVEGLAKEKEDRKEHLKENAGQMDDEIPLFYTDLMHLLVDEEGSIGEDAFVWLASLLPLVADVVNARFTFETLTAPTAGRLHFPAYDRFLKEMNKCVEYLQKQQTPTGMELKPDEFILHVEGTANTHRVVRHIGSTSWPGRLTLTNHALYFEASGAISYETALKIDLSDAGIDHQVEAASTGPWGVPLFDKAITYESDQQTEPVVLEFPERTSSTRRDHWLALVREVILLHQFISKYSVKSPKSWEIHARTILGILRLRAARVMLRISPPAPTNFLIFSLLDDLPKGDYVLEDLSNNLEATNSCSGPSSATFILQGLNMSFPISSSIETTEIVEQLSTQVDSLLTLEETISQAREEAKETTIAKANIQELKNEGISDSFLVLMELLNPLKSTLKWFQEIYAWKRPVAMTCMLAMALLVIYKEWLAYVVAISLMGVVGLMLWARHTRTRDRYIEIMMPASSNQMSMKSIATAQHAWNNLRTMVQTANITILKIKSILASRAPKHAHLVMLLASGVALILAVIPFKFITMGLMVYFFVTGSSLGRYFISCQGNRRLREWWDSVPVAPVCLAPET